MYPARNPQGTTDHGPALWWRGSIPPCPIDTQIIQQYPYAMFVTGFLFTLGIVAALVCLAHWRAVLTVLAYVALAALILVGFASVHH